MLFPHVHKQDRHYEKDTTCWKSIAIHDKVKYGQWDCNSGAFKNSPQIALEQERGYYGC